MSNLIHVGLYGDGSRKSRLRAEYIYCDHADECSAHKKGLCFCVTSLFGVACKLGRVSCVDGGTKQSKKYYKVHDEAQENPMRAKLKYPSNDYVTRIGDKCLLTVPNISAKKDENGKLVLSDPGFRGRCNLILDLEELTPEVLKQICSFRPRAIMGGVIESYQEKSIPMFLFQFSKLFPEEYKAFTSACPEYADLKLDFRGKWAKLSTCNRDATYKNSKRDVFRFDGDYLVCEEYSPMIVFQDTRVKGTLRVPLTDKMEVEITDNEQVTPETVFI